MLWAKIRSLIRSLRRRQQLEDEMSEELRFHVEKRADDLALGGDMPRGEALRQARLEFGSPEKYKEQARRARGLRLLDELRCDLKYASRTLRRNPGFAFAAIVTLALGIGANTAVFSAVDAAVLKKLPVHNPDDLVAFDWIWTRTSMLTGYSGNGRPGPVEGQQLRTSFSYPVFERIRDNNQTLSDIFAFSPTRALNVVADEQAETASAQVVTGGYFTGLGIQAILGRVILPIDDVADANPVTVISYRYWQRRFTGNPAIVGKAIRIDNQTFTVIGVSPGEFFGTRIGESPDLTIPMAIESRPRLGGRPTPRSDWWVQIMGRLRPGIARQQVLADVHDAFETGVLESWDARPADRRTPEFASRTDIPQLRVIPGAQGPISADRDVTRALPMFSYIVATILLIVCANLANLLLARASSRQQEISVRLTIGSSRPRLVRQLLTESMVLAFLSGGFGAILAYWGKDFLAWLPATSSAVLNPQIDLRVLGFTAALSFVSAMLLGLGPAFRATRRAVSETMRTSAQRGDDGRSLIRKALIVAQVSASLVLLAGAGLFIGTVRNLENLDVGFNPANLVVFDVSPRLAAANDGQIASLFEQIIENIQSIPGVRSATMSAIRPLSDRARSDLIVANTGRNGDQRQDAYLQTIRYNFFDTMEMALVLGRDFAAADNEKTSKVVVINETLARQFFDGLNPIGRRLTFAVFPDRGSFEIVGVVRDAKYSNLRDAAPPTMYFPVAQAVEPSMSIEVRTAGEPAGLIPAIRETVQRVDPNLPLARITTQQDQIRQIMATERAFAAFSSIFGVVALLLASMGLYGIISFGVGRRTHEIGLRMAVGAERRDVVRLIMRETFLLLILGIAVGLAASQLVTRLIGDILYGIAPHDAATLLSAVLIMTAVSAAAAYLPARRASRMDPMAALRYE